MAEVEYTFPVVKQEDPGNNWQNFPIGLRVLAVDDDPVCLKVVEEMLKKCQYEVTTCVNATSALQILRDKSQDYDLVLSDVYMPDMDGFKLLEMIGLELDLPVIMMSSNGETSTVLQGVTHGACDFLIKPVRIEELKNMWQHVIRRRKEQARDVDSDEQSQERDDFDGTRKRKEPGDSSDRMGRDRDDDNASKKARVVWSVEMHQQFVNAVNQLGIDKAVPKKILEIMNVDGLTRENVASHLQKYRLYLKRVAGVQPAPPRKPAPSIPPLASVSGAGLPGLPSTSQPLNPQSLPVSAPLVLPTDNNLAAAAAASLAAFPNPLLANPMAMMAHSGGMNPLLGAMGGLGALNGMAGLNPLNLPNMQPPLGLMQGLMPGMPGQPGQPGMMPMGLPGLGMPGMPGGMPMGMNGLPLASFMQSMGLGQMPPGLAGLAMNGMMPPGMPGGMGMNPAVAAAAAAHPQGVFPGPGGMPNTPGLPAHQPLGAGPNLSTAQELAILQDPNFGNMVAGPSGMQGLDASGMLGIDNNDMSAAAAVFNDLYNGGPSANMLTDAALQSEAKGDDDLLNFFNFK